MTANWAAAVVNVLILAFFVVVAVGIGIGAYAATTLKKLEAKKEPTETGDVETEPTIETWGSRTA